MNAKQVENLEDISIDEDAIAEQGKALFVETWGEAKANLEVLKESVKNPAVKWILSIAIALGNGFQKKWSEVS